MTDQNSPGPNQVAAVGFSDDMALRRRAIAASAALSRRRESRLRLALGLNIVIVGVQVVFGLRARSLGLLADAGHNLTDAAAVLASLIAVRWARRRPTIERSFGFHRGTILAAQANAASILAITAVIAYEGIRRLIHPEPVSGGIVVVVATGAAIANLVAALALREGHSHGGGHDHGDAEGDLNMRSALLHMAGDALASVGVAIAGAVILVSGRFDRLDPALSLVIGLLIAYQAWKLLRSSADVLLESTPRGLDVEELANAMETVDGVEHVHDLHVWSLSSEIRALSAHVVLAGHPSLEDAQVVGVAVKQAVVAPYRIAHATLELECESCGDETDWCAMDSEPGRDCEAERRSSPSRSDRRSGP